ncbi:TM2 domain-containing protein, partial [Litorivivens sp.]
MAKAVAGPALKGVVLDFDEDTSRGIISALDSHRYEFEGNNWLSERFPGPGMHVDFVADGERATQIYIDPCNPKSASKNRMAAALLAFFFGWLGFHKYYLHNNQPATIMLCVSLG